MDGRTVVCYRDDPHALKVDYVSNLIKLNVGMYFKLEKDNPPVRKGKYLIRKELKIYNPELIFVNTKPGTPCLYYLFDRVADLEK